jgi:hypothetical protein
VNPSLAAGAIAAAFLTQSVSASDQPGTSVEAVCEHPETSIAEGEFRELLVFGDRHGTFAIIETCADRIFDIGFADSDLNEPKNREFRDYLRQQAVTDRFASAISIRADFEPNMNASPRYPGKLRVKQILGFRPTERRLFDLFESNRGSEQAGTAAAPSP